MMNRRNFIKGLSALPIAVKLAQLPKFLPELVRQVVGRGSPEILDNLGMTFFVDSSNGDNSLSGLTPGDAMQTLSVALDRSGADDMIVVLPDSSDDSELLKLWEPHRISLQQELVDVRKRMMPWAEAARDYQEKLMSDIYDKWETTA